MRRLRPVGCALHPRMIDSHSTWITSRGPATPIRTRPARIAFLSYRDNSRAVDRVSHRQLLVPMARATQMLVDPARSPFATAQTR